ncbi:ubiquinol-cytochrome c reductase iron-sulfur subunit [Ectothiorhodospira magna]|uniref:Ubiquinol-cytochrome c reductase iron-sulfur subunit n=1 Tax=Ectothiorhodospira magna TaxID=867345 RepID=A0A1H8Z4N7_9GAMM|nr:ubiquinol-cytochrome c reductase iron-sulfur subunit [Ectothiorhodospira magna]SEP58568.1 ubiquinol-cytochrome c reductase iron-sulfur subunit [Ectothiorhodospira magna]
MTTEASDVRVYYRVALKLLALLGILALAYTMIAGFFSEPQTRHVLTQSVDISSLAPGEMLEVTWSGRPVVILRRSEAMMAADAAFVESLYDPGSRFSRQPRDYRNPHRSATADLFVAFAVGTDLGCRLDLVPPEIAAEQGWGGGFIDRCRQGRYDFAGRVYNGQDARRNLEVPDYRLHPDGRVILEAR